MTTSEKILRTLLRHGAASRSDLARTLRLSRPAVSSAVEQLLRNGTLHEGSCGASSGGKPPILLEFNVDAPAAGAIGIDIGHETLLRGVLCNAAGEVIATTDATHENTFDSLLLRSAGLIDILQKQAPVPVRGVGVAVAGQVDYRKNEVVYCGNFPLKGREFARKLAERIKLGILLDNRARCAAQWEYFFGAAREIEDFIFISAERGIGTATYHGGRLFSGRAGVAGEIRDLLLPTPDGRGVLPIERALNEKHLASLPDGRSYLRRQSAYIITLLSNLLDPSRIVLGGRFREYGEEFISELIPEIHLEPERQLSIELARGGRIGAALGAALNTILTGFSTLTRQQGVSS